MSVLTSFLENSSIHGLGFIAQTRAFARVFWVIVVICGFSLAGFLIWTNFQNWADSPVTTTMETLPIAEAPFPRVTVCPPKHTFTNLNYDLLFASNVSMSKEKRDSLLKTLFSKALDFEYSEALKLYIQEENDFRNWYDGLTVNDHPFDLIPLKKIITQKVKTHALAGSMSTPSFSQKFDISAFRNPPEPKGGGKGNPVDYAIEIDIGMLSNDNEQLYLNVEIDANILEGLENILVCNKNINKFPFKSSQPISFTSFTKGNSSWKEPRIFCPPWLRKNPNSKKKTFLVTFRRFHIYEDDVNEMKVYNRSMTGINVSWSISSKPNLTIKINPEITFNYKEFKNFVHAVDNFSGSENSTWEIIRKIKRDSTRDDPRCKPDVTKIMQNIKQNLKTQQSLSSVTAGDPSDDLLNMAGKMFIYIKTNPRQEWIDFLTEIKTTLEDNENNLSPKKMLLLLSNLKVPEGHIRESIQRIFIETLSDVDNFIFNKVDDLTSLEDIGPDITTDVKG